MNDKIKLPESKPHRGIDNSPTVRQAEPVVLDNPAWRKRPYPWPSNPTDTSPLEWWRTLPSDAFGDAERLLLATTLEQIHVLHGDDDFAAALKGDPSAAIGVAFSLMPIDEMTLKADIAMTALLRCALERNAAAALVLAQVLGLTNLCHSYATDLSASWLAYGRRCSDNPRKFRRAGTVLQTALRERHRDGGDA